jgi:tRNA threonylcarbamoyl adenosine modification protein YeaZ
LIFVIDTSAKAAMLATIDGRSRSELIISTRDPALMQNLLHIASTSKITKVAVATGPGSFTGLRTGVSFGLGLAMGLRVPIVPLPSLELLAMRSEEPAIAVIEAGRGRFYYRVPGAMPALGEPAEIPVGHPMVGAPGIAVSGHRMKPEDELRPFAEAAEILLRTAQEVPYRNLEIEYMQSFSVKR